jgi:hypothetical protein
MMKRLPLQEMIRTIGIVLTMISGMAIIYFSLVPGEAYPTVSWIPFGDKGDHMAAYAGFGFSLFLAMLRIPGSGRKQRYGESHSTLHLTSWSGPAILASLSCGAAFGGLMELIQPLFGRSCEWFDFFADIMGLVVGVAVALLLLQMVGSFFRTRPWLYDPNWEEDL